MEQQSLETTPLRKRSTLYSLYNRLGLFDRLVFIVAGVLLTTSALTLMYRAHESLLSEIPAHGGAVIEGVIGSPRFINPLLAITDADRDLTALVYSGLMKASPEGNLELDLAESSVLSEDGLTYTFVIREDAVFHDGTPVTARDVVFTIQKAQDPSLRSPKRVNWEGVSVAQVDERTVSFTLSQPYVPFLQNMTLGILPSHIWDGADIELFQFSEYNSEPIGSGPYTIHKIKKDDSGIPSLYELRAFSEYIHGEPYISKLILKFYPNEETLLTAFAQQEIERVNSIQPTQARLLSNGGARVLTTPLPRVFGLFLNPTEAPVFKDDTVREALDMTIDRERIIAEVLQGYATELLGPLPPGVLISTTSKATTTHAEYVAEARELLDDAGWEENESGVLQKKGEILTFTIATSNIPELRLVAELLREMWSELNVDVVIQVFEPNELTQNIIRPRKYDALLFGEIIGRDLDLYAFWHSSQRFDPGYNIGLYTNITVDKALDAIRVTTDTTERTKLFMSIFENITEDKPALFIYAPDFIYVTDTKTQGMKISNITVPSERFININEWYIHTERIWPFLNTTNNN